LIPFALNHIWQSTLFSAVVGVLALALRGYSARARFWLWMSASLKFLVPFAILAILGSHLSWRSASTALKPPKPALTRLAEPFPSADVVVTQLSPLSERTTKFTSRHWGVPLFVLWLAGFASTLGYWLSQLFRIRKALRGAVRADGALAELPLPVLLTDSTLEPGVF
jgi:bla regulator protein BlaR1